MSRPLVRRPSRIAAWAAIFAIALHALWPLIAEAKPSSVILVPLCTVGGETHYQELPGGPSPIERHSAAHQEDCSSCCCLAAVSFPSFSASFEARTGEQPALSAEKRIESRNSFFPHSRGPPAFLSLIAASQHDRRDHEEGFALRHRGARAGDADGGAGELRLGVLHH